MQAQPNPRFCGRPENWNRTQRRARSIQSSREPEQFRQPGAWAASPWVWCLFPPRRAAQAARGLGALSQDAARLFPPRPQWAPPVGCLRLASVQRSWPLAATLLAADVDHSESRKSLDRNRGPVCSVGGGGFSGAEFAPFHSPLPPTSGGDGRALLWSFSVPLCCEPPAVCSGWFIFYLATPQFKRARSDCSQGLQAGP